MRRAVIWIVCATLLGGPAALAEARGVGTSAGNFWKAGLGARPSGMGGAFVAVADDLNALEWNPAGLSQLPPNYFNASFEHVFWFQDVEYEVLSMAQYLQDTYGAGVQILYRHMPDINNDIEDEDPLKVFDLGAIVGYGIQLSNFSVGLNLKLFESRLGTEDLFGQAVDLGVLAFFLERKLALGLAVQNLGPDVLGESLPMNIGVGAAYRETFGEAKEHGLNAALEIDQPLDNKLDLRLGAEYWYLKIFGIRIGYRQQLSGSDLQSENAADRLTAGLSARWADVQLDYGFVPYAALGGTHRLAVSVKYGPLKDEIE